MKKAWMRVVSMIAGPALLALGGCVNQGEYDKLYDTNRSLTDANARLQQERDAAQAALDQQRNALARAEAATAQLRSENEELRKALEAAGISMKEFESRLQGLSLGPLDAETDQALSELAAQFPDLIQYDPSTGMLRFSSDLTFDSGSDAVKASAREAIDALARILQTPAASRYDVLIEGHTDSQRISAATAKRHPTNRHLSVNRSISVLNELSKMGVNPGKMMAAGWGEFIPLVPNTPSGNTPENRRVEIYLMKSRHNVGATVNPRTGAPEAVEPDRTTPPARPIDVTK